MNLTQAALYWRSVLDINENQKKRFSQTIVNMMYGNLNSKIITIFGVTFKKNTNDVRESVALSITNHLVSEGAILHIYDPRAKKEQFILELQKNGLWNIEIEKSILWFDCPYKASINSQAIVILSEWDEL